MNYKEFINNLEGSYKGKFGDPDLKEIEQFFIDEKINNVGIQNLYTAIKRKYIKSHDLPTFGNIFAIWEANRSFSPSGNVANLDKDSPLQQLYIAKDWPPDKIINHCQNIRLKQSQAGSEKLSHTEISFLLIWEDLINVQPEFRSIAKEKMIANGDRQLSYPVNLSEYYNPELFKPTKKVPEERKGITVAMQKALGDVF